MESFCIAICSDLSTEDVCQGQLWFCSTPNSSTNWAVSSTGESVLILKVGHAFNLRSNTVYGNINDTDMLHAEQYK